MVWHKKCGGRDGRSRERTGLLIPQIAFTVQWLHDEEALASLHVRTEPDRVTLTHPCCGRSGEDWNYAIPLDWTRCHLGGKRPWFAVGAWRFSTTGVSLPAALVIS